MSNSTEPRIVTKAMAGAAAELAEQIARKAHAGQFRRDGSTPYITHPAAVVEKLRAEDDETTATAWLHDVLEDTSETAETLHAAGVPERVIRAVLVLTKRGEPYAAYLDGVKRNPIACKVKVADMLHNLSDSSTERQIVKYARGLLALLGETPNL